MQKRDRFMLEQMMMKCWHVTDDIETVANYVGNIAEMPAHHKDEVLNMLNGIESIYNQRFSYMLELFGEMVQNGHIEGKNVY
jgi:hypothetical protein